MINTDSDRLSQNVQCSTKAMTSNTRFSPA